MLLTIKVKLYPNEQQEKALLETIERFNEACDYISKIAWSTRTFGKVGIQKIVYYDVREKYNLSAQMVVRAIGKVAESYRVDKTCQHEFNKHGAIVYDQRILTFKASDEVSILTLEGRERITIKYGEYCPLDMERVKGQADLIYHNNTFYLMVVVDVPDADPIDPDGVMGVDMGIVNIATTSDGEVFSGKKCTEVRQRYSALKARLQSVGTYSAKKHLKKISGKERRFKKDTNHCIAKAIVQTAKDTNRAIAIENLKGIRTNSTVNKAVRTAIGKWAFDELGNFLKYKATLAGIPVFEIDPKNTSRECSVCGHIDKKNRKTQAEFCCVKCGHQENADINASKNISLRGICQLSHRPLAY
ncbi:RNA-guided endonuclease InsQ/TnpB family protein [Methanolobus bombayensis]|uniref:RNA-guided endonuclease InsQ/TnpB family protein n=1 Tax=Methanolobus bombayensis TaxID=38023 RepID=UPI001AE65E3A|nr:RNA-guided endonuclease TnpB family protein [Methanolobus bombayensis]MBP1909927.1 IS605 OrfB family transposase [Methanolobus bombayensis]